MTTTTVETDAIPTQPSPPAIPPPPVTKTSPSTSTIVKVLAVCAVVGGAWYGYQSGFFDTVPTKCADMSARQLQHVYQNSLLGKMGLRILAVQSSTDIGSTSAGLRCRVRLFATNGEMTFTVSTKQINGDIYIEMVPNIFD